MSWRDLLCPSVCFCSFHRQCCIKSCFEQTLQQSVTQQKQASSLKCCTCSDVKARIWKGNLKDCCKDKDEASDVLHVSQSSASIITPYANAEEVGNYSQACFILPDLPELRLKCNSARLHRQYRAKTHRQTVRKGLCWIWRQSLGRELRERCWLRNSLSHGLHPSTGEGIQEAVPLGCVFKLWDEAALWDNPLSTGFTKLFLVVASWGSSPRKFSF